MEKHDQETEIIEKLGEAKTLRSFLIEAVEIFSQAIGRLIQRVFRKDDYAVRYAVEPLLGHSGPLGQLPVRLKLLYGLGVIPQSIYQDIEKFIELRDFLNNSGREFHFTDPEIIESIKALHTMQEMGGVQLEVVVPSEDMDPVLYQMQLTRQEQVVRSALALVVASICKLFNRNNPLVA